MKAKLASLAFALLAAACTEETVPGGEVTIRNDILDKEYNEFTIDQVMTARGNSMFQRTLKPGQQVTIPAKQITSMRFVRRYKDFSRVYVVECPADGNKKITIKLIDIHINKLRGGCALTRRGELRDGFYKWDPPSP